jgi:hypothetical protein
MLSDNRIDHYVSDTAKRKLEAKWQSLQWAETGVLAYRAQYIAPLTAWKQTCHLCISANIAPQNTFCLESLSKPEKCTHGEASTVFWARGSDLFKDTLGDLARSEHPLSLRVRDRNTKSFLPSEDKFNGIETHNFLPNSLF